jgi:hypothetical protein
LSGHYAGLQLELLIGAVQEESGLEARENIDWAAIERLDNVAGLQARRGGRSAGQHVRDDDSPVLREVERLCQQRCDGLSYCANNGPVDAPVLA